MLNLARNSEASYKPIWLKFLKKAKNDRKGFVSEDCFQRIFTEKKRMTTVKIILCQRTETFIAFAQNSLKASAFITVCNNCYKSIVQSLISFTSQIYALTS